MAGKVSQSIKPLQIPVQHMYVIGHDVKDESEQVTKVRKMGWYKGNDPRLVKDHLYTIVVRREEYRNKENPEEVKAYFLYMVSYDHTDNEDNGTVLEYEPDQNQKRLDDWKFFEEGMIFDLTPIYRETIQQAIGG